MGSSEPDEGGAAPALAGGAAAAARAPGAMAPTVRGTDGLDLDDLERELLLEAIHRRYGFDFRRYASASLKRRLRKRMEAEDLATLSALQDAILHDPQVMERLLLDLSINVTSMFRDPTFYASFRANVVPLLRTHPFIRIWHAGCSTGEEVWSMAILLEEEGLLDRTRLYATDMNEAVLETAREGTYPIASMREWTENYIAAGGTRAFSEHYTARYDHARFDQRLGRSMVFARHNLATDGSFNEFHVVVCRNVLIYFDPELQHHVHQLFLASLDRRGVLALGSKESVRFSGVEEQYDAIDRDERIYRRRGDVGASA